MFILLAFGCAAGGLLRWLSTQRARRDGRRLRTGPWPSILSVGLALMAWAVFGLAGNGVLVILRHERAFPLGISVALSAASLALAAMVVVHAFRRSGILSIVDDANVAPTWYVVPFAIALALLCLATAAAILLSS